MIRQLFDLSGRKALVTGGSIGVGRACATALAMAGADVAIIGRKQSTAERACNSLRDLGIETFSLQCDVSDPEQVIQTMTEIARRFGRIDIAINNAGGSPTTNALSLSKEDWSRTLDVNLSGVFWCAQAQARHMSTQDPPGGKIINIASMYASIAAGNCVYNASKAGVVHLTRSLAAEWGAFNINVNCISPGWILTPGNPLTLDERRRMREVTPMGSLIRYEDLYGAVIYLASAASDCVTGQELTIDGGHTINTWLEPLQRKIPPRARPDDEESGLNYDRAPI